ncbi:MAG: hypothetical protein ABJD11_07410 [Gemmatimonadota bacterium]
MRTSVVALLIVVSGAQACERSRLTAPSGAPVSLSGDWVVQLLEIVPVDTLAAPCTAAQMRLSMVDDGGLLSGSYTGFGRVFCHTGGLVGVSDTVELPDGPLSGTVQTPSTDPGQVGLRVDIGRPPNGYLAGTERAGSFYGDGIITVRRTSGEPVSVRITWHAFK